jgi:hypothetical protein
MGDIDDAREFLGKRNYDAAVAHASIAAAESLQRVEELLRELVDRDA